MLIFKKFHNRFDFSFFVSSRVISSSLVVEVSELKSVSSEATLDRLLVRFWLSRLSNSNLSPLLNRRSSEFGRISDLL